MYETGQSLGNTVPTILADGGTTGVARTTTLAPTEATSRVRRVLLPMMPVSWKAAFHFRPHMKDVATLIKVRAQASSVTSPREFFASRYAFLKTVL